MPTPTFLLQALEPRPPLGAATESTRAQPGFSKLLAQQLQAPPLSARPPEAPRRLDPSPPRTAQPEASRPTQLARSAEASPALRKHKTSGKPQQPGGESRPQAAPARAPEPRSATQAHTEAEASRSGAAHQAGQAEEPDESQVQEAIAALLADSSMSPVQQVQANGTAHGNEAPAEHPSSQPSSPGSLAEAVAPAEGRAVEPAAAKPQVIQPGPVLRQGAALEPSAATGTQDLTQASALGAADGNTPGPGKVPGTAAPVPSSSLGHVLRAASQQAAPDAAPLERGEQPAGLRQMSRAEAEQATLPSSSPSAMTELSAQPSPVQGGDTPPPVAPTVGDTATLQAQAALVLEPQPALPPVQEASAQHAPSALHPALAAAAGTPAASTTPLPAATGSAYLRHAPGHTGFAQELGAQVAVWVREGVQQAQLNLNPAELGPVQVRILLEGQQAQVQFVAEHSQTRDALQASVAELNRALQEEGLSLGRTDVQAGHDPASGRAAPGQDGRPDERGGARGRPGSPWGPEPAPNPPPHRAAPRGLLDLYA